MNTVTINTVNGIKADVANGKRSLKAIAVECRIFEQQSTDDLSKAIFARLSDCKTRSQFNSVIASI